MHVKVSTASKVSGATNDCTVVSHGVQRRRVFIEPKDPEYLMLLTKAELTGKISGEIRKYYQNQTKTAQLNSGY